MPDREKVIKEFEAFVNSNCPADFKHVCHIELMSTVLALLKEREPISPTPAYFNIYKAADFYHCGKCHAMIVKNQKYCHDCGQAVKWNG